MPVLTVEIPRPQTAAQALRAVDAAELLALDVPPREVFLAPWLTAQSLSMIWAWRGTGKTLAALAIAYAVASGGTCFGWRAPKPRRVLYLDGELPCAELQARVAAMVESEDAQPAAGMLRFLTPDLQPRGMPNIASPQGQLALAHLVADAELIIVDSIATLGRAGRENEAESWQPVAAWALEQRAAGRAVLFIHHAGKGGQQRGTSAREDILDVRCVVSVSMLTEGWDANTVTHVLGVRAFGTQLLCEQVVGRALRRQSYELNAEGLLPVEYADVLGVPFDFTARPVIAPPQPPRETVQVRAVRPERDALEIRFPRVAGYRVQLPETRLTADFDDDSVLTLTPDLVGPAIVHVSGIIGEGVDLNLKHLDDIRQSTLLFHLTRHLVESKWRDDDQQPQLNLFGQLKRIAKQWLDTCLVCKGGTYPAQLAYRQLADMACDRITAAITRSHLHERPVLAMLDPYNPVGSTAHVNFTTTRTERWETDARRCHVNWVILDSGWEGEFCRVAEAHPRVVAYVKNRSLGLEVPYQFASENRIYIPDYIVQVDDGHGKDDPLNLIVEIKGYRGEDAKEKASTMRTYWVPGVNNLKDHGRWAFAEFTDVYAMQEDFAKVVAAAFDTMIETATQPTETEITA